MRSYLAQRFVRSVLVLLGLSLVVFVLLSASGDPAAIMASPNATEEQLANIRRDLELDQPGYVQYAHYVARVVTGDFGRSWKYQVPVLNMIGARLAATVELALAATLLAVVVGGVLGVVSATRRGTWIDVTSVGLAVAVRAVPSFWLGLMSILLFSVTLGLLPTSGRGTPLHLIMPATTLALAFIADILLLVRAGMLEVLSEDYIRTARSKGLAERTVNLRHALKNAALTTVSMIGITLGRLFGGAVITETVFSWPGVGSLAVEAVTGRDFPLVQASVFVLAAGIMVVNLATDLCYAFLNPRISVS